MDDTPNQGRDPGPPSPEDAAPGASDSSAERRLIEAALAGAQPASGWPESSQAWFEGAPLPPHGAFPGYDIVREIHRGGQGVVYQAVQLSTRRHVAIKVMHSGPFMGSSGRARFEREVQVLGQLDHPNIVRIHDSGITRDGSCFYVMDYISGKPLDKLMAEGQLPIRESLRLFAKICDAVNAAHLKGVIHRDLKPANIRIDKHGEPIVVDFGLAKLAIPEMDAQGSGRLMSMTGQFIGSLPWASPEQADGSPTNIDVRTDVYSLGVILYQLLTSRFPYEVLGNMRDVLDNILRTEPARPSTIRRKINDEVETIVLKALAKQRERRYQSAGELGRDVHRFLEGQPIEAKRDSGWYVITKTLKRYRGPVALGIGSLAALIVFAVVVTVLYREAEGARGVAEQKTVAAEAAREAETEQRGLAEARLENAYDLAGTMLTEFYDAIANLRGATAAKLALAKSAVGVVDQLEAGAAGDPDRMLLIGQWRLRLGKLFAGREKIHRVGGADEGAALYSSALAIAEKLIADDGSFLEAHLLKTDTLAAIAHGRRMQQDYDGALAAIRGAIASAEQSQGVGGVPAEMRVQIQYRKADSLLELGNAMVEQWMTAEPGSRSAVAMSALDSFEQAHRVFQTIASEGIDSARGNHGVANALVRRAQWYARTTVFPLDPGATTPQDALAQLGRAEDLLTEAFAVYERLEADDPKAGSYAHDHLLAMEDRANVFRLRGEQYALLAAAQPDLAVEHQDSARRWKLEAVHVLELAVEKGQRSFNADEANVMYARRLALILAQLGRSYESLSRYTEAETAYERSIELRDVLVATDPTNQHFNDAVVGWYRLGSLRELEAGDTDARGLRAALDAYTRAREFVQRQLDAGVQPDNTHLKSVEAQIDAVRRRISSG